VNCTNCGTAHHEDGSWCEPCKERSRARRRRRVTAGLCPACGRPKSATHPGQHCDVCREAEIAREEARVKRGLCRHCGQRARAGSSYCAKHLEYHAKRMRMTHARKT
jgi:hypothetical protein